MKIVIIMYTMSEKETLLGIIFIVNPFQLPYVKVSHSLQSLQLRLDLSFFLQYNH